MKKIAALLGKMIDKIMNPRKIVFFVNESNNRPNDALKKIFETAGLQVIKEDVQKGLPAGLFTVRM